MAATPVGLGTVRQVWFAKTATPSTKSTFLIRDDTYSKSGAQFGRSIRLGDPVNLGPNSTWTQGTWEGGEDQEFWSDVQMYQSASVDSNSRPNKLRMWPGWKEIFYDGTRTQADNYVLERGVQGSGFNTPLYFGEQNIFHAQGNLGPVYRLYRYLPAAGTVTQQSNTWDNIRSMASFLDDSTVNQAIVVTTVSFPYTGTESGGLAQVVFESGYTRGDLVGEPVGSYATNAIAFHNRDIYFLVGSQIVKLHYNLGAEKTWTNIGNILTIRRMSGIAVWNNSVWFGVANGGGRASVYVTNGFYLNKAFDIPDEFEIMDLHVHYGQLYISGFTAVADGDTDPSRVGRIYAYSGSSLKVLYEEGSGKDNSNHTIFKMASLGSKLVWGRPATASTGMRAGVKMWDAEKDSIFDGPTIEINTASTSDVLVPNVIEYDSGIAACFFDKHNYGGSHTNPKLVAVTRPVDTVRNNLSSGGGTTFNWKANVGTTKTQQLKSSHYLGTDDVEAETKTWLVARIQVKLPNNKTRVDLSVLLDENTTPVSVGSVVGDSLLPNFRSVDIPLKVSGDYLQSKSIQYFIELSNTEASNVNTTDNPQIRGPISIQWKVAPVKRRQWEVRVIGQDAQSQLPTVAQGFDGTPTANPITTAQAMADKVEEFWSEGKPVLFWEPSSFGDAPVSAGTEVNVTAFSTRSYRVESDDSAAIQEIAVTLVENT